MKRSLKTPFLASELAINFDCLSLGSAFTSLEYFQLSAEKKIISLNYFDRSSWVFMLEKEV